jgi:hypothetical protein
MTAPNTQDTQQSAHDTSPDRIDRATAWRVWTNLKKAIRYTAEELVTYGM